MSKGVTMGTHSFVLKPKKGRCESYFVDKQGKARYRRIHFQEKVAQQKKKGTQDYQFYVAIREALLNAHLHSRFSSSGENFRLHCKRYARLTFAGKHLKIYLALDPKQLKGTKITVEDVSKHTSLKDVPLAFKVHSGLAVRRAIKMIETMMEEPGDKK
jgi:hypothetical protein